MTMITPSYLGETIEYSSLHACRSTLEDPKALEMVQKSLKNGYSADRVKNNPVFSSLVQDPKFSAQAK